MLPMEDKQARKTRYVDNIDQIDQLDAETKDRLRTVSERFAFRANDYYLSLIDWDDPEDPIRRIIVPHEDEMLKWGRLDPSSEDTYTIMPGLEHKYESTALLLVSNTCGGICRYCFRKRVFIDSQSTYLQDVPAAMDYIAQHSEITNVLLTGGDPLILPTPKLADIVRRLRAIDHVQIVRIGTRMPVFNPYRVLDDPSLLEMLETYSTQEKKMYVITHFVHARELTDVAIRAVHLMLKAGAIVANQTPLIAGLNDRPEVLAELLQRLSYVGAVPYYIFQCRPAVGNKAYTVPIEAGYEIVERAKSLVSGLAKRARYVMSHATGKIEVMGRTNQNVWFKYHRAASDTDSGRCMVFRSNPDAYWLDDYVETVADYPIDQPYRVYGPQ